LETNIDTGRNDLCPCGSGKKYKKCCLAQERAKVESFFWHRVHACRHTLATRLLPYAREVFGEAWLNNAWREFQCLIDGQFEPESTEVNVFLPWFFFNWTTNQEPVGDTEPPCAPPAELYLEEHASELDELQTKYIEACLDAPFSFFEVLKIEPGVGFRLKDVFSKAELDVVDQRGSTLVKENHFLFAKAVTIDGLTTLEACGTVLVPPAHKKVLQDLRREMRKDYEEIGVDALFDFSLYVIEAYQNFRDLAFAPAAEEAEEDRVISLVPLE
jgi:hypothetical protein